MTCRTVTEVSIIQTTLYKAVCSSLRQARRDRSRPTNGAACGSVRGISRIGCSIPWCTRSDSGAGAARPAGRAPETVLSLGQVRGKGAGPGFQGVDESGMENELMNIHDGEKGKETGEIHRSLVTGLVVGLEGVGTVWRDGPHEVPEGIGVRLRISRGILPNYIIIRVEQNEFAGARAIELAVRRKVLNQDFQAGEICGAGYCRDSRVAEHAKYLEV